MIHVPKSKVGLLHSLWCSYYLRHYRGSLAGWAKSHTRIKQSTQPKNYKMYMYATTQVVKGCSCVLQLAAHFSNDVLQSSHVSKSYLHVWPAQYCLGHVVLCILTYPLMTMTSECPVTVSAIIRAKSLASVLQQYNTYPTYLLVVSTLKETTHHTLTIEYSMREDTLCKLLLWYLVYAPDYIRLQAIWIKWHLVGSPQHYTYIHVLGVYMCRSYPEWT